MKELVDFNAVRPPEMDMLSPSVGPVKVNTDDIFTMKEVARQTARDQGWHTMSGWLMIAYAGGQPIAQWPMEDL